MLITSKQNLIVERMWPEVNHRVNYPIKRKLIELEDQGLINMELPTIKFCVSFVCVNVTSEGLKLFVEAWNAHPITGIKYCSNYNVIIILLIIIMLIALTCGWYGVDKR